MTDNVLEITDPVVDTQPKPGIAGAIFGNMIRDERDLPFIRLAFLLSVLFIPLAAYLFIPGNFNWWLVGVYWLLYGWFLGPYILMLHNTSHRVLFKKKYDFLNHYIPWVIGPFVGMSPETYYVHHMAMHHVDGNLPDDLSSTMKYQRDSFIDFLKYYFTFIFGTVGFVMYLVKRKRTKMVTRFLMGEGTFLVITAALLYWNFWPALMLFAIPLVFTRLMLMAGNWGQHAFVDPEEPKNDYRTVISFVNSPYNHRCFNDGYHLGHHLKASRHWLDMPADFLDKREKMIENRTLVFDKLDYFMIFVLLMLKRYKTLTKYIVQLDPENPLSEDELLELFHRRLRKFDPATLRELSTFTPPVASSGAPA
ncbi:MAG: fatty acid desaturase [Deltaproteobacteria bacterium]|nr:MAG: fatty acid desaturase [Deltaproteobacteria bacterium]